MNYNMLNSRNGQRTNQKYRNLIGSDQQMQRLEETDEILPDEIFENISQLTLTVRSAFLSSVAIICCIIDTK